MIIQTHEDWEIVNSSFKIFDPPGTRIYPCIEISINAFLFHVDILTNSNDDDFVPWRRFIAAGLTQAFIIVDDDHVKEFRISLQSRRGDNHEYQISTIIEILEATEPCGQKVLIYICEDGKRVIDTSMGSEEKELTKVKSIYQHGKKPAPEWLKANTSFQPSPKSDKTTTKI